MQLRSFISAGLWAVLSLGAPAYAAMPAGNSAPAITTDVVNVAAADNPLLFTHPQSLSYGYLDVNAGGTSRSSS